MAARQIRATLRAAPDGMTTRQLAETTGMRQDSVGQALPKMPDVYIDRWVKGGWRGRYIPVWCAVEVPANCPPPETRRDKSGELPR